MIFNISCRSVHEEASGLVIQATAFLESDSMIIPVSLAHEEAANMTTTSLIARTSARFASPHPAFLENTSLISPMSLCKTPLFPRSPWHPLVAPSVLNLSHPWGGLSHEVFPHNWLTCQKGGIHNIRDRPIFTWPLGFDLPHNSQFNYIHNFRNIPKFSLEGHFIFVEPTGPSYSEKRHSPYFSSCRFHTVRVPCHTKRGRIPWHTTNNSPLLIPPAPHPPRFNTSQEQVSDRLHSLIAKHISSDLSNHKISVHKFFINRSPSFDNLLNKNLNLWRRQTIPHILP